MIAGAARRHLERLAAAPRPAGSPAEADARRYCSALLASLGFTVSEEAFAYSTVPGRWATPAAGIASIAVLAIAGHLGHDGDGRAALLTIVVALLIGVPAALWMARRGVLDFPVGRTHGINLVATRGTERPGVWLVAHLDSKSQPIPTAARATGIVATAIAWGVALIVAALQTVGADIGGWWILITIAGSVAALPVAASVVGAHSPGALDNASGIATILEAIAGLDGHEGIGVLMTSGEELGLAGARAIARRHPRGVALNCDGVDDLGTLVCMRSGRGPSRSVAALEAGAARVGVAITVRGLVPGLLVDAVALHEAGWDCATLSRGTWATLARVHRPHDDLHHLTGSGVEEAALVLAAAVRQLRTPSLPGPPWLC